MHTHNRTTHVHTSAPTCRHCGDDIDPRRFQLGYRVCLWCGEEAATTERMGWCVVQEYSKGAYQLVTTSAARKVLLDTNPKNIRS